VTREAIPPTLMRALNTGEVPTVTLAEWLAIDTPTLAGSVLRHLLDHSELRALQPRFEALAGLGVTRRVRGMGSILNEFFAPHRRSRRTFQNLRNHPSDMVRAWTLYWTTAGPLELPELLRRCRGYAVDDSMMVRECAWDAFRPAVARDLGTALHLLQSWVSDADFRVRRCAVEATRPRGVWAPHISSLKESPEAGRNLLDPLKADPSRYVRLSVGNWLNDASKTAEAWVANLCATWLKQSRRPETAMIVRRALRTIHRSKLSPGTS
jgi:3-methyladenine DNA glycosylase AlkC